MRKLLDWIADKLGYQRKYEGVKWSPTYVTADFLEDDCRPLIESWPCDEPDIPPPLSMQAMSSPATGGTIMKIDDILTWGTIFVVILLGGFVMFVFWIIVFEGLFGL